MSAPDGRYNVLRTLSDAGFYGMSILPLVED
jgi:hypothetical protein